MVDDFTQISDFFKDCKEVVKRSVALIKHIKHCQKDAIAPFYLSFIDDKTNVYVNVYCCIL